MGDNESSFPVQGLIIGPSMALFDRAQYGHEGRFCSRDFIELFILNYFLFVFVAYSMVLEDKCDHCFFVCNLRPDFKRVKFDVRRSLEPF